MSTLRIRSSAGESSFEPGQTVLIGRDADADVRLQNTSVSRRHAEIVHSSPGWVLQDLGSGQGTWRDGRRVERVEIRGTVTVTLGREGRGEMVTLEAAAPGRADGDPAPGVHADTEIVGRPTNGNFGDATAVVGHAAPAGGDYQATVLPGAQGHRPGGRLRDGDALGATVVTGDTLNVECAGRSHALRPGKPVTIGRDPASDIVSANPTVSRNHARLEHDGSGWVLHDLGSSGGTFVDGRRVSQHRLEGSVAAWLGDQTTGERLVVVASGSKTGRPTTNRRRTLLLAIPALVLAVAAGVLVWQLWPSDSADPLTNDDLARATVHIIADDRSGSGAIVDAREGLILTNAHVVAPSAPGTGVRDHMLDFELDDDAERIVIFVAPGLGKAAEPRYLAETVAVDGYLDLAVLRITDTTGGRIVEPGTDDLAGLVEVPIGSSDDVGVSDEVRVFGYPTAAQSGNVTLTEGIVSNEVPDRRLGANRGMFNITAQISPGNSGGLAVNAEGELIGVPTLIRDETVGSMRPSAFATALIDSARSGADEPYESPFIRPITTEEVSGARLVEPDPTTGVEFACDNADLAGERSDGVGVAFDFEGFTAGEHQDLAVMVVRESALIGWFEVEYPTRWAVDAGCAVVTLPLVDPVLPGDTIVVGVGPNYATP